jgi:TRAP-type transport system small permease protein
MTEALQTPAPPDDDVTTPELQRSNLALRVLAMAENGLIIVLILATVGVVLCQVGFRYLLDKPLSWSTEIATDLLVYIAFVGFAIGVRDNAHVAMRLFERKLGIGPRRAMRIGELVILGTVIGCIGYGGAIYASEQSDVHSPTGVPLPLTFIPLPLGAALSLIHILVEIFALLRGAEPPGGPEAGGQE